MTTIVTRAGKGSPLTNNEVDANFTNLNDAKIETLTSTDTSVTITGTGSTRDLSVPVNPNVVSGPASATDNAVARFDTTTGKLIQNSVVTIDDAGNIENVIIDSFTNTVGADHIHYKIKANENIARGDVLKYVGWNAGANAIEVVKTSSVSDVAIGMSDDDLTTGSFGLAVVVGTTEGFDTSAYTAGTILYSNGAGGLTATKPTTGTYQACAFVIRRQSVNGAFLVNFSNPVYVEASTNTANTAVIRDGSGNFSAGTIAAALNGNAATATTLQTARTIQGVSFNGSANITVATAGTGISVSGTTITNTAPDRTVSLTAGTGINTSGTYPNFTITNSAPDQTVSIASGTGVSITGTYPSFTAAIGQAVGTGNNVQFNSLGVGTAASGTAGEIRATNNITAYYSDDRLKTKLGNIENALEKLETLSGFYYEANQTAQDLGYEVKKEIGVSAQQVQAVMPEIVAPAPIDEKYLTVRYERLAPLFIEAIKELSAEVKALKAKVG